MYQQLETISHFQQDNWIHVREVNCTSILFYVLGVSRIHNKIMGEFCNSKPVPINLEPTVLAAVGELSLSVSVLSLG